MMRWLVDAMNVIGSRPDGWWRDRAGAARRLTAQLQQLAADSGDQIAVTFEGQAVPDLPAGRHDGVTVLYARRGGQNAADDRIVEEVSSDDDPGSLTVVTSDRDLARRVRDLGASVVGPNVLLGRLAPPPGGAVDGRDGRQVPGRPGAQRAHPDR
jgi:predicted RNA-binding protein with PIN domain